ncbi:MAG: ABC transporter ATP-binding protein [Anaerolineales bacterium]|nr:MAG: ABC transporter ATP-binding protein [Anaerolineales bacterium]
MEYDIEFIDVSFTYEGAETLALEDINLKVQPGEVVLLTGPSGAGKTTLCSCLNGLVPHFHNGMLKGQVRVKGRDTKKTRVGVLSSLVGLVFQDPESQLISPTVADEIAFGPENLAVPRDEIIKRVEEGLEVARLEGFEEREPHNLSEGEQQACAIAAIFAMYPEIYVMDEPTSNLDPLGTQHVLSMIVKVAKERGKTLFIAEHKLEEILPLVDRVVIMDRGRIVRDDTVEDTLSKGDIKHVFMRPPLVRLAEKLQLDAQPLTAEQFYPALTRKYKLNGLPMDERPMAEKKGKSEPVIEIKGLCHSYDGVNAALNRVDLTICQGELMSILGKNGSGKTTLVKHINGLLKPAEGSVVVLGQDTTQTTTAQLAKRVGFCFQNPNHQMITFVVKDELALGPKSLGLDKKEIERRSLEALDFVGMAGQMKADVIALGKGQKQRLALASVLTMKPEILIIDEPTTGQDPQMTEDIFKIIRRLNEEGTAVLVITHKFDYAAAYTERAVILANGSIVYDGPMGAALMDEELLRENSLAQPQVTKLAAKLAAQNVPGDIVTMDQMYDVLSRLIAGERYGHYI